jgi:hypothetical protein
MRIKQQATEQLRKSWNHLPDAEQINRLQEKLLQLISMCPLIRFCDSSVLWNFGIPSELPDVT